MGNIFSSSIGRKLIMSITGCFLILFMIFHLIMNAVLVFNGDTYNTICAFLGTNWYALAGTAVLAAGVGIHFIYATILTLKNRKARGSVRYAETKKEKGVEWASKNMYILGVVVIGGLLLHLFNFWFNMQFAELMGSHENQFGLSPADGAGIVKLHFSNIWYVLVYIVWLIGLWFHLTHGFWSMLHTVGWNSKVWMKRMKAISYIVATLLVAGFMAIVITLYIQSLLA